MSTGAHAGMMQGRSGPRGRDGLRGRNGLRPISCGVLGLIGLAFVAMPTTAVAQNTPPAQAAPQAAPSSAAALPQNTVPPEFAAWWNRLWSIQSGEFYQSGMEIKLRTYNLYRLTDAEAAKLRAEVAGKPEHPGRGELNLYDRQIKSPRAIFSDSILAFRGGEWRASTLSSTAQGRYNDRAWTKDAAFELDPEWLLVTDPSHSAPDYSRFGQQSSDNSFRVSYLLATGLTGWAGSKPVDVVPKVNGPAWAAEGSFARSDGATIRLIARGNWDLGTQRGTVNEVEGRISLRAGGEPLIVRSVASDFRYEPEIDWMVPRTVTSFAPNGMPEWEFQFQSVRQLDKAEFAKLVKLPRAGELDAVRGSVEFKKVTDTRGTISAVDGSPNGSVEARTVADGKPDRSYRWLGWALGGSLLLVFVGLRLRRP